MARHLTWFPQSGQANGVFPGTISANSVYNLASIMDGPFDLRSGVDPIVAATLVFSATGTSALSSRGIITSTDADTPSTNAIAALSANISGGSGGYSIAVGQTVGGTTAAAIGIELEYNERGMVENPL